MRHWRRNADEDLRRLEREAAVGAQREIDRSVAAKLRAGRADSITLGELRAASSGLVPREVFEHVLQPAVSGGLRIPALLEEQSLPSGDPLLVSVEVFHGGRGLALHVEPQPDEGSEGLRRDTMVVALEQSEGEARVFVYDMDSGEYRYSLAVWPEFLTREHLG